MLTEGGVRSRSHGLAKPVLEAQAQSLGVSLVTRASTWEHYEVAFRTALAEFRAAGIERGVFGDIDLQPHLDWVQRVCAAEGITPVEPLWQGDRRQLLGEFLDQGFRAIIVAAKDGVLRRGFLGRQLSWDVIAEMAHEGIDVSGEKGEYHTVVTDGPLFSAPLRLRAGDRVLRDGYWFLDVALAE